MALNISLERAAIGAGATTGVIGVANFVLVVGQRGQASGVSLGMLLLTIALAVLTGSLTALALILRYMEGRPYRGLLIEAARRPEHSDALAQIIDADSRHEAIKSGRGLIDKEQRVLYRPDMAWPGSEVQARSAIRRRELINDSGPVSDPVSRTTTRS
ncbi:hypothetical protein ABZ942_24540 [Nocardia sp. NPDC046473]|uniref:hypothetical protein n=1 Tax=Nocardia sp. NPDC046473 TaxID=3155733 RepID=UPI0034085464